MTPDALETVQGWFRTLPPTHDLIKGPKGEPIEQFDTQGLNWLRCLLVAWGRDGVLRLVPLPEQRNWELLAEVADHAFIYEFRRLSAFAQALERTGQEPALRCLLVLRANLAAVGLEVQRRLKAGRPISAGWEKIEGPQPDDLEVLIEAAVPKVLAGQHEAAVSDAISRVTEEMRAGITLPPVNAREWVTNPPMSRYLPIDAEWERTAPRLFEEDLDEAAVDDDLRVVGLGGIPAQVKIDIETERRRESYRLGIRLRHASELKSQTPTPFDFAREAEEAAKAPERIEAARMKYGHGVVQACLDFYMYGVTDEVCAERLGLTLHTWQRRKQSILKDLRAE